MPQASSGAAGPALHCYYCGGTDCAPHYRAVFHPRDPSYGPFDIYVCRTCGSSITYPLPDAAALRAFYAAHDDGLAPELVRARAASAQTGAYNNYLDRFSAISGATRDDAFTWIDLAAGTGVFASVCAERFPRATGIGVDLHPQPGNIALAANVRWLQADLADPELYARLPKANVVFALAVLEHVEDPPFFVGSALDLLLPGGTLYMMAPDNAAPVARLMRSRWPYWLPGEHLHNPTPRGLKLLAHRLLRERGQQATVVSRPIAVHYTLQYVGAYLGLEALAARLFGPKMTFPVPAGSLELGVTLG